MENIDILIENDLIYLKLHQKCHLFPIVNPILPPESESAINQSQIWSSDFESNGPIQFGRPNHLTLILLVSLVKNVQFTCVTSFKYKE